MMQDNNNPDYRALPAKVSQWILKMVSLAFKSFFNGMKSYKKNPKKFKANLKFQNTSTKPRGGIS